MKHLRLLLLLGSGCLTFTGCETTGDPNSGGIFWSERKAQDRLAEREDRLDSIERDTARVNRSNRRLEGAAARRQRMLGE